MTALQQNNSNHATARQYVMLAIFCFLLFGFSATGLRPLTLEEARLPQTSAEMLNGQHWLVPHSGDRPLVEHPPLPHWLTLIISMPFGGAESLQAARLSSALIGSALILLLAFGLTRLLSPSLGMISAAFAATLLGFVEAAWLIQDEIFLCLLITSALLCAMGVTKQFKQDASINPIGKRPWALLCFYLLLGLCNMSGDLFYGPLVVCAVLGLYLLIQLCADRWRLALHFIWLPGLLIALLIAFAWPVYAAWAHPGAYDVWHHLLFRSRAEEQLRWPWFTYAVQLLVKLAPWTPLIIIGLLGALLKTMHLAHKQYPKLPPLFLPLGLSMGFFYWLRSKEDGAPLFFIACWAIVPFALLHFFKGYHPEHLLYALPAFGVFAALGLRYLLYLGKALPAWLRQPAVGLAMIGFPAGLLLWVIMPMLSVPSFIAKLIAFWVLLLVAVMFSALHYKRHTIAMACLLMCFLPILWNVHAHVYPKLDQTLHDDHFLKQIKAWRSVQDQRSPLYIDAQGSDDHFRLRYTVNDDAQLLHNLSYLKDDTIHTSSVLVITREWHEAYLRTMGNIELLLQSSQSRGGEEEGGKLSLYRLNFHPDLERFPYQRVSPMQAIEAMDGPYIDQPD